MLMRREICKFKTGSKKVLAADSAAALSPPGPSHQQHGRPLDFQLTLPGHWIRDNQILCQYYDSSNIQLLIQNVC